MKFSIRILSPFLYSIELFQIKCIDRNAKVSKTSEILNHNKALVVWFSLRKMQSWWKLYLELKILTNGDFDVNFIKIG